MTRDSKTTDRKMTKTGAIIAALEAHPDKMPKELEQMLQAEGWDIKAQRISTIKSKLKSDKKAPKAASAASVAAPKKAPATKADGGISFDSLKKAKQMAEQLGGIQQAKAAIAALAELVD